LNIQPGVQVVFQGHYTFMINQNSALRAIGNENDSITFSAPSAEGWGGLRFISANDSSFLSFCIIQNARTQGVFPSGCGGGVYSDHTNLTVRNSTIRYNYSNFGGGIFLDSCSTSSIISNIIEYNDGFDGGGGGISYYRSSGILKSNIFRYNHGLDSGPDGFSGAGVLLIGSSPNIRDNTFHQNHFYSGSAIWMTDHSNPLVSNNLFFQNQSTTIDVHSYSNAQFINNSIYSTYGCCILIHSDGSSASGFNNIIWADPSTPIWYSGATCYMTYSDIRGGFPGQGNINLDPLFTTGIFGDYYLSQIASGQTQQSPCVDAGMASITTGTTRTDNVPDLGITDMGYHYQIAGLPPPPPPPLSISLTPLNPPIIIPAQGGSFSFNVTMDNDSSVAVQVDAWINIIVPGGVQFTILGPFAITLPQGALVTRLRSITVPASAPSGDYVCLGTSGDYPWMVYDTDQFWFSKEGTTFDWLSDIGWFCSGEPYPGEEIPQQAVGHQVSESGATPTMTVFPSPFNASTALSYKLQASSYVSLKIYDVAGRLVATLAEGWREAGRHSATFDGSGLASGVYLVRLEAGGFTATQKLCFSNKIKN
jgi:hypothetical protein